MPNWRLNMDVVASTVPVGSATASLLSKVTAAFTPDSGFEKVVSSIWIYKSSKTRFWTEMS